MTDNNLRLPLNGHLTARGAGAQKKKFSTNKVLQQGIALTRASSRMADAPRQEKIPTNKVLQTG